MAFDIFSSGHRGYRISFFSVWCENFQLRIHWGTVPARLAYEVGLAAADTWVKGRSLPKRGGGGGGAFSAADVEEIVEVCLAALDIFICGCIGE